MQSHKKPSSLEFLRTPNFQDRSINSTFLRLCVCFVLFFFLFHSQEKLLTSLIEAPIIDEKKFSQKYDNKNRSYVPKVPLTKSCG